MNPMAVSNHRQDRGAQGERVRRIVICDFAETQALRGQLLTLIDAAPGILGGSVEVLDARAAGLDLVRERLERSGASLVFVVLGTLRPGELAAIFQAIRAGAGLCPVLAVADELAGADLCGLLRLGASDFLTTPLRASDFVPRVTLLLAHHDEAQEALAALKEKAGLERFVGRSEQLLREVGKIPRIARCDAHVLIAGETGTGKEVCARSIHYLSRRADGPFIPLNCGALPVDLIENELFGHEAGAYTSATTAQAGLICEADGGTLFLDEVDALPPAAQVKLLRFLQNKEVRALGGRKTRKADLRVVAATNAALDQAIRQGRFREDLFYRLNVLSLTLPPLRQRREDIPLLATHFMTKYALELDRPPPRLDPAAIQKLLTHSWPGNVRELENVVQRAVLMAETALIRARDLNLPGEEAPPNSSFRELKARAVDDFERGYLQSVLHEHQGNISAAARAAQKNRRAFWELLRKHRLVPLTRTVATGPLAPSHQDHSPC